MRAHLIMLVVAGMSMTGCESSWDASTLFVTPDQQGRIAYERGDLDVAVARFEDPMWRGVAAYEAGQYEVAIESWSRVDTAESWFARGNALVHLEQWEAAIEAYEMALVRRPEWREAEENIAYARLFIPWQPEGGGGEMGTTGQDARPDEIVFDADEDRLEAKGRDEVLDQQVLTDEQIADMWLQQVDTSPASFLRLKFRYQTEVE